MDQRRVALAIVLSLGVILAYNYLVVRPRQEAEKPPQAMEPRSMPPAAPEPAVPSKLANNPTGGAPAIVVESDVWRLSITPQGGRIVSAQLKGFRRSVQRDSPPLELIAPGPVLPLTVEHATETDVETLYAANVDHLDVQGRGPETLVLTGTMGAHRIEKRLTFEPDSYVLDVDVRLDGAADGVVGLGIPMLEKEGLLGTASATQLAVILSDGKIIEKKLANLDAAAMAALAREPHATAVWAGFSVPYFLSVIVAAEPGGGMATIEAAGATPIVLMSEPLRDSQATFKLFMGPKSREVLEQAGSQLNRALDFGWFWFIALPMLYALRQLHKVSGNYGVDIILLTALVRVATIPLMQKSFRSMRAMQKLQPQLKRLQEQYKEDQTRLQKEMMELYKRNQVNPFSGCAPMVLQIPIFVGLYNALSHAIELRHAPFALWITDLSAPERLVVAGVGLPVLTILMGGTMIVQQWLTPSQADPTQRQMMMVMPVVFTFMFINFPSGLVLYWLVSNLLGIAQQWVMLRSPT